MGGRYVAAGARTTARLAPLRVIVVSTLRSPAGAAGPTGRGTRRQLLRVSTAAYLVTSVGFPAPAGAAGGRPPSRCRKHHRSGGPAARGRGPWGGSRQDGVKRGGFVVRGPPTKGPGRGRRGESGRTEGGPSRPLGGAEGAAEWRTPSPLSSGGRCHPGPDPEGGGDSGPGCRHRVREGLPSVGGSPGRPRRTLTALPRGRPGARSRPASHPTWPRPGSGHEVRAVRGSPRRH